MALRVPFSFPLSPEEYAHNDRILADYVSGSNARPFPTYELTSVPAFTNPIISTASSTVQRMKFLPQRQKFAAFTQRVEVVNLLKEKRVVGLACAPSVHTVGTATQLPQVLVEQEALFGKRRVFVVRSNDALCSASAQRTAQEMCVEGKSVVAWYHPLLNPASNGNVTHSTQIVFVTAATMLHILLSRASEETEIGIIFNDFDGVVRHHAGGDMNKSSSSAASSFTALPDTDVFTLLSAVRQYLRMGRLLHRVLFCAGADVEALENCLTRVTADIGPLASTGAVAVLELTPKIMPPEPNWTFHEQNNNDVQACLQSLQNGDHRKGDVVMCLCRHPDDLRTIVNASREMKMFNVVECTNDAVIGAAVMTSPEDVKAMLTTFASVMFSQTPAGQPTQPTLLAVLSETGTVSGIDASIYNDVVLPVLLGVKPSSGVHVVAVLPSSGASARTYTYNASTMTNYTRDDGAGDVHGTDDAQAVSNKEFVSDDRDMNLARHVLILNGLGMDAAGHNVVFAPYISASACVTVSIALLKTTSLLDRQGIITTLGTLVAYFAPLQVSLSQRNTQQDTFLIAARLALYGVVWCATSSSLLSAATLVMREMGFEKGSPTIEFASSTLSGLVRTWLESSGVLKPETVSLVDASNEETSIQQCVVLCAYYPNYVTIDPTTYVVSAPFWSSQLPLSQFSFTDERWTGYVRVFNSIWTSTTGAASGSTNLGELQITFHLEDVVGYENAFSPLPLVMCCAAGGVERTYPARAAVVSGGDGNDAGVLKCRGWFAPVTRAWYHPDLLTSGPEMEGCPDKLALRSPVTQVYYTDDASMLPTRTSPHLGTITLDSSLCLVVDANTVLPTLVSLRKSFRSHFMMCAVGPSIHLPPEVLQATAWCAKRSVVEVGMGTTQESLEEKIGIAQGWGASAQFAEAMGSSVNASSGAEEAVASMCAERQTAVYAATSWLPFVASAPNADDSIMRIPEHLVAPLNQLAVKSAAAAAANNANNNNESGATESQPSVLEKEIIEQFVELVVEAKDRQLEHHARLTYAGGENPLFGFLERSHPHYAYYESRLQTVCPDLARAKRDGGAGDVMDELGERYAFDNLAQRGESEKERRRREYMEKLRRDGVVGDSGVATAQNISFVRNEVSSSQSAPTLNAEELFGDGSLSHAASHAHHHQHHQYQHHLHHHHHAQYEGFPPPPDPSGAYMGMGHPQFDPMMSPYGMHHHHHHHHHHQHHHNPALVIQEATEEELENAPPAVIVEPIPTRKKGEHTNIPLILAKALGEALGTRVGPTCLLNEAAQIQVPSKRVQEKALSIESFMCLGERLTIRRNNLLVQHKNAHLTKKLEDIRARHNREEDRPGSSSNAPPREKERDQRPPPRDPPASSIPPYRRGDRNERGGGDRDRDRDYKDRDRGDERRRDRGEGRDRDRRYDRDDRRDDHRRSKRSRSRDRDRDRHR
eukprot:PhM_4_TR17445/c0_g1_i1/m.8929